MQNEESTISKEWHGHKLDLVLLNLLQQNMRT
jgi:hypothetical protein